MDKKKMLLAIISHYASGNKARFAQMIEVTPQAISTWLSRNSFDTDRIFAKCDGISADWLLSGVGEMLRKRPKTTEEINSNGFIEYLKEENKRLQQENRTLVEQVGYLKGLLNQHKISYEQTA